MGGGRSQSAARLPCTQSPLRSPGTFSCSFLPLSTHPSPSPASCWNLRQNCSFSYLHTYTGSRYFCPSPGCQTLQGLGRRPWTEQCSSSCGADILTEKQSITLAKWAALTFHKTHLENCTCAFIHKRCYGVKCLVFCVTDLILCSMALLAFGVFFFLKVLGCQIICSLATWGALMFCTSPSSGVSTSRK